MPTREELYSAVAKIGTIGAIAEGLFDGLDDSGSGGLTPGVDVANIADTSTADAEEIAEKVNELLTSLRDAGIIA